VIELKRRSFLSAGGLTLASILAPKVGLSQATKRAAVVIGVNKAGNLPKLQAAASGAGAFADWLEGEGFDVDRFIDGPDKAVKIDPIFDAVKAIIDRGIYDQLVIYFSGHGFLNGYSELWMLSGAPDNSNQAVSLIECNRLCKRTGIPNVVFISDACRSTATSLAASSVRGSVIFPTTASSSSVATKVDTFLATQEGDPAYEVGVGEATDNYYGIYTESFLDAFKRPEDNMISTVDGIEVVLNRDLEGWLSRDVNRRAQRVSISIEQRPETNVASNSYIGSVKRSGQVVASLPSAEPTFMAAASVAFTERGFGSLATTNSFDMPAVQDSDNGKSFRNAQQKIEKAEGAAPDQFETETGLFVFGAKVVEVLASPDLLRAELAPEKGPGVIRIHPRNEKPGSVAIRFSDGSGTVVAGLPGYIGTLVVDDGRVVSVTYNRSGHSERRVSELRNLVATSARFGTFRIPGTGVEQDSRAKAFADEIRMMKAIDPTLGLYAAYAYAEADLPDQIRSVMDYMQRDIQGQFFDVALLANTLADIPPREREGIAPFCPMLSQGWGLLRISNTQLAPEIDAARDHIRPALWTTFERKGMDLVLDALSDGIVS